MFREEGYAKASSQDLEGAIHSLDVTLGRPVRAEPNQALIPTPSENILSLFYDLETVVRMRILAVIDYLNRIQEK